MGAAGSIVFLNQEEADISGYQFNTQSLAKARFDELDTDKSGYLKNEELIKVTEWVMEQFGDKLGTDPETIRNNIMARLDANGDGKLDREEFLVLFKIVFQRIILKGRARAKFNELDIDKSGVLESKEIDKVITWTLSVFPAEMNMDLYRERLIKQIDRNVDAKICLNEFLNLFDDMLARTELMRRAQVMFDELDKDKSGMLEKAELDIIAERVLQVYPEKSSSERASLKTNLLNRIDANGDGKLSLQEFTVLFDEILQRMDLIMSAKYDFELLDTDKSGFLEQEELKIMLKKWGENVQSDIQYDTKKNIDDLLSKLDVNGDGKLSLIEFVQLFDESIASSGFWINA